MTSERTALGPLGETVLVPTGFLGDFFGRASRASVDRSCPAGIPRGLDKRPLLALHRMPQAKNKSRGVQEIWTDAVMLAASAAERGEAPSGISALLSRMGSLGNVPRQEKKFKVTGCTRRVHPLTSNLPSASRQASLVLRGEASMSGNPRPDHCPRMYRG